jgi:nitrile hydratase beta subunit
MNGIHDMGGMLGMGPIRPEANEPVFHARWEARIFAITRAVGAWGRWNIDASRHQRELIPAPAYLRMSYYEKWLAGLTELLVANRLLTRGEIATGRPLPGSPRSVPALAAERVPAMIARGAPASRNTSAAARFEVGQSVRARNMHPTGHTRLPRYVRARIGSIDRDHGVFVFPDTNAHFQGEHPQHVYSVRFAARELWGDTASARDSVYVDLWEEYLEPA